MPIEIIIPRLGWSMEEGAFVMWLKKDGEFVRAGDPLFSIEGDKAVQEIESMDSGILRIAANGPQPGQSIRVGDVLGHLLSTDEAASDRPLPSSTVQCVDISSSVSLANTREEIAGAPGAKLELPRGATTVAPTISPRALRAAAELGVNWTTVPGSGRTGRIRERDIRAAATSVNRSALTTGHGKAELSETRSGGDPTILVTGGGGFIGTWVLRELLERGMRVVVLDAGERPARWEKIIGPYHRDIPLIRGSLLDRELLMQIFADHGVTHVIHLAALLTPACQVDPWEGCQVNVMGTVALLEQIRVGGDRIRGFSYASSVAVFGEEPDHLSSGPARENQPPTFYGAFKKAIETFAEQYWRHFRVASVGIRPQVVYGPERDVGLTAGPSLAARAVACGQPYCIGFTGRVGFDYVEDVARALVRACLETPRGAYVVDLPGEMADVAEVVKAIVDVVPEAAGLLSVNGPPIPAHAPPLPMPISSLYSNWQSTPLAEGIRRTIEFYRERKAVSEGKPNYGASVTP